MKNVYLLILVILSFTRLELEAYLKISSTLYSAGKLDLGM